MKSLLGTLFVTISILLHLSGSSILQQTPWTSSREVSCSWDDRGFLVDGKPFIFTEEELATSQQLGRSRSRNNRIRSIYTKDVDKDDVDDETIAPAPDDSQGELSDDALKMDVEENTTDDQTQVADDADDTHSSTHGNDDDDNADGDNDDDKDDDDDVDVSSSCKGGVQSRLKRSKPSSSSSRVHNNAAAIAEVKALWRDVIRGAREGCLDVGTTGVSTIASSSRSSSTVLSVVSGLSEDESSSPTQLNAVSVHVKSSLVTAEAGNDVLIALRANGTDRVSFLRQVCQQYIHSLNP